VDLTGNTGYDTVNVSFAVTGIETGPGGALYLTGYDSNTGTAYFGRRKWPEPWEWDTLDFFPTGLKASENELILGSLHGGFMRSTDAVIGVKEDLPIIRWENPLLFQDGKNLILFFKSTPAKGGILRIYDEAGRLRFSSSFSPFEKIIFLPRLNTGIYLYEVMLDNRVDRGKILWVER
jgi:hypothetical protein